MYPIFPHNHVPKNPYGTTQTLDVATKRGTVLNGVLFNANHGASSSSDPDKADTVLIAITGIHGNFYSNPFYFNFGHTLNRGGFDFVYAQTNNAFSQIETVNTNTGKGEVIGSWNERFEYTDEDIDAYVTWAHNNGYRHIVLAGHSLGANKVINYLSHTNDPRVNYFLLLSPANLDTMMGGVTVQELQTIKDLVDRGDGDRMLPFAFMGWVTCTANTAYDWAIGGQLNNVHLEPDADYSQLGKVEHTGALLIGTYDTFTHGDPSQFLENINRHMPTADRNKLVFIQQTGHTYQQKEQETAEEILKLMQFWAGETKEA